MSQVQFTYYLCEGIDLEVEADVTFGEPAKIDQSENLQMEPAGDDEAYITSITLNGNEVSLEGLYRKDRYGRFESLYDELARYAIETARG